MKKEKGPLEKRREKLREEVEFERAGREKLLDVKADDADGIVEISLRPARIADFVGQEALKENLSIALQAAKKRKEPLEHILLSGPPGLGKTTLAHIVAHEMNAKIMATSGPAIERAGDLIGILTNLEEGDILFIDEIHRLSKVVEEFVYPAMEDYKIDFIVDKGPYAKTIKFALKRFTLIGATTRQGLLSSPLRDRFGVTFHLEFYEPDELTRIVRRSADLLSIKVDGDAAMELAKRSRGTPRIANKLLRRVRDYAQVKSHGVISREIVDRALEGQGIDRLGLDALDRKVLKAVLEIYSGGPVGVESLAATLNEEVDTLVDVVEPFLLKSGFLKRTPRGREATSLAREHLGVGSGSRKNADLFSSKQ
ncbi:MAG TPA: Holliday junction branch migration DNA helicase RuvB [Candidatus Omnitrophota bacterium]|nr:Holliday junction branch migration DNA helicase RuvB [Candidatus Omnitrophota bacterium]